MATEIVSKTISPAEGVEKILLMDDYGTPLCVNIPLTAAATRQSLIDSNIAAMDARVTTMEGYATDAGIDLSTQKAAGEAKRAAAMAATNSTTPPAL